MIDKSEIITIFASLIEDEIFIRIYDNQVVLIDDFYEVFKNAEEMTYDALVAIDNAEKGYKNFFDKCKADGILS